MTYVGINPNYAIKSNLTEQRYPALQVTNYKPITESEKIDFCLSESSFNLLYEPNDYWKTEVVECIFGRETVFMHRIISTVRWIFLNIPQIFLQDKTTKQVSVPQKGVKLFGTNKVTIAKCFLACLSGDNLVLDIDGKPQIFTLKLTSSKTQLIGYQDNTENQTILALNRSLQQHFKTKDNLVHLVSVNLEALAKEFVSNHSGESSLGVSFELVGNAKVLNKIHQKQIFDLLCEEDIQALFNDPFNLQSISEGNSTSEVEDLDF